MILELLESEPMQRLKGINQLGLPDRYFFVSGYSRYEHSLGVMILLHRLGASREEQIAGLLHDVSHTAFSHIVDWLVGNRMTENYQDDDLIPYIARSGLSEILREYEFNHEDLKVFSKYTLLEQELPLLCADRVDYALRQFPPAEVSFCFEHLINHKGLICFDNQDVAKMFAQRYLNLQENVWSSFEATSRWEILAEILRYALQRNYVSFEDLWLEDEEVIEKLLATKNKKIILGFDLLANRSLEHLPRSKVSKTKKFRWVDPLVLGEGASFGVTPLSTLDPAFERVLRLAKNRNKRGVQPVHFDLAD